MRLGLVMVCGSAFSEYGNDFYGNDQRGDGWLGVGRAMMIAALGCSLARESQMRTNWLHRSSRQLRSVASDALFINARGRNGRVERIEQASETDPTIGYLSLGSSDAMVRSDDIHISCWSWIAYRPSTVHQRHHPHCHIGHARAAFSGACKVYSYGVLDDSCEKEIKSALTETHLSKAG